MSDERGGWDWEAFVMGPFWYLSKGMTSKGIILLIICMVTVLCAVPFIWVYCGVKGRGDWYEYRLREKSRLNLDNL